MMGRRAVVRRRPLLRAAAVGGTLAAGSAMGRRSAERSSAEADQDQRIADLEGQQGAQQTQPAGAAQSADTGPPSAADQLSQLATLHQQGALTDEEFATAKAKILGG
ncbi:MAG: SHOCT domain-containing protein [Streptosporangiaceae bacterium]